MAFKSLFASLAIAGFAAAQSSTNTCSTSATATISSAGDAAALAGCATYSGSIAIATGVREDINIPNVRLITGDLVIQSTPNLTTLGADSLVRIGRNFNLNDNQNLATLNFPFLNRVGSINFIGLPNLRQLGFTDTIRQVDTLNLQNTRLNNLNGINLNAVQNVFITGNGLLQEISFQITNISNSLIVESNGDRLSASFPNLQTAQNITFRNTPTLAIPALVRVNGTLGLYDNPFDTISTPNLTTVTGTVAIVGNNQLTNITMPKLVTVGGGLQVQNNSQLTDVSTSFANVQTIGGAFDFFGVFTNVKLPALKDNRGAFNLQSTGDITADCATFRAITGRNSVIKGTFTCGGNQTQPRGAGSTPTGSSSSTSTRAASDAGRFASVSAVTGFGGLVAALFGLL